MTPLEVALHARKKIRQFSDARSPARWSAGSLAWSGAYPRLPDPGQAPALLREALAADAERILSGRWRAFRELELRVDDPPRWHKDYLRGADLETDASAFSLDHRRLPNGADIKLIWELSRWQQLVRLAMAAYVLGHRQARAKCLEWLDDWVTHNPPYRGWNWTSALEAGIRLVQFTWIYALLEPEPSATAGEFRNARLRLSPQAERVVPAHVRFIWRHQSFGSSANNHLLGELAGLTLAAVAWPTIQRAATSLDRLQYRFEQEIRAQFNRDGGNREQAFNYQLFSWELCWQVRAALRAAGRTMSPDAEDRLRRAARFYVDLQVPDDPWDYGDSDGSVVVPLFADERAATAEWHEWLADPAAGSAIDFWWRAERVDKEETAITPPSAHHPDIVHFAESGHALWRREGWVVRLNVSPLGYLKTAAHGHVDALHLSIWHDGVAVVVDPGTGAYYGNEALRAWLASPGAHNGPVPELANAPQRLGTFLWGSAYDPPAATVTPDGMLATVRLGRHVVQRRVRALADAAGFEIEDRCSVDEPVPGVGEDGRFSVTWQFAPDTALHQIGDRSFRVTRHAASLRIEVSADWTDVHPVASHHQGTSSSGGGRIDRTQPFAGTVSQSFRKVEWAPCLALTARPEAGRANVFRTTFVAEPSLK